MNALSLILLYFLTSLFLAAQAPSLGIDPDMGDHPGFAHAMKVETRNIDGINVVYHYDQVRPDFDHLISSSSRTVAKLSSDDWSFRFDPDSLGMKENWQLPESKSSAKDDWQQVTIPHCWDAMPGGKYWDWNDQTTRNPPHYNGAAWYQKTFNHHATPDKVLRQRIAFLGVQQRARIYLNGNEIALHEGGGAPFSIDISEHIKEGENTLALKVIRLTNYRKAPKGKGDRGWQEIDYIHTLHPKAPDCWPYAGILRDVYLIEESPITIRKSLVHTSEDDLHATLIISNHGTESIQLRAKMTSTINDTSSQTPYFTIEPKQTLVRRLIIEDIVKKATPWTPETPQVYTVHFTLEDKASHLVDQQTTQFGVRSFGVKDASFVLNNKPVFLKGASIYAEHPDRAGALTKQDHRDQFTLFKDTKSNFARLHVTQRDPYVYQLANELGIMVCGEWGGFWYKAKSMDVQTKDPYSIYQTMARCAVWDMLNHPSVVLWGLNNECHQFCPEYEPFLRMSRELVLEIDYQKRPITWAAWHPHKGQPHFELADAVGFNEYRGAMDPFHLLDPDMKQTIEENPNKPIIIMENGAWSKRGSRGPVTSKNNENWQADLLKRQWDVLTKYDSTFAGYAYWLMTDYRSRKPYTGNKNKNGYSRMGVYDEYDRPKELVREAFRNLPHPKGK